MIKHIGLIIAVAVSIPQAAEADAPAWCLKDMHLASDWVDKSLTSTDAMEVMENLPRASCQASAKTAGELAAARARWNKELDLTEADWATDVVPYTLADPGTRRGLTMRTEDKQAPSKLDAIGQYAMIKQASFPNRDPLYALDQLGSRLSAAGRLAYIENCLHATNPAEWALCQPDIDAFDRKQIGVEMHADKTPRGYERMTIRVAAARVQAKLPARAAAVKELMAKDPGYAQLFAVAATAHKEWAAKAPDASLLAVTTAMDDARATNSSKAFAGCEDTTWAAFTTAVGALPAAKFKELKSDGYLYEVMGVLINDPSAYLAMMALRICRSTKTDVLDRYAGMSMTRWPGYRGPRTAALTSMLTGTITLDDRSTKIQYPEIRRTWLDASSSTNGGGSGVLAKVNTNGDKTHVEFVRKPHKMQVCLNWKDSNQIVQITASGSVIYGYTCLKYGTETVNLASEPRDINTRYAAGVKPGAYVSIIEDVVLSVSAKAGGAPSHVLGVPVK